VLGVAANHRKQNRLPPHIGQAHAAMIAIAPAAEPWGGAFSRGVAHSPRD
jgi:hypothetical protein